MKHESLLNCKVPALWAHPIKTFYYDRCYVYTETALGVVRPVVSGTPPLLAG